MAKEYWKRRWLNRKNHHGNAFVAASVDVSDEYIDADVTIADCSRQITLDLSVYARNLRIGRGEYSNSLHKVNTLIQVLTETRDALTEGWEQVQETHNGNS